MTFRDLTRKDKELDREACIRLLKSEKRGTLSVIGEHGYPYSMPMNHWYEPEDGKIYFHCGKDGHRTDALKKDDRVCFCVCHAGEPMADHWALSVKSVIVFGRMEIIEDRQRIVEITTKLCHKFTQDEVYIRSEIEQHAHKTALLALTVEHLCGKQVTEA